MKIIKVKIQQVRPAAYNPRRDLQPGDKEYEALKRAMIEFGQVEPIVWNKRSGNLVGGHQRFKILVNDFKANVVDAVVVDLDPTREKALNVALNKIAGAWDIPKLKSLLVDLDDGSFDLELTGFDEAELKELIDWESGPGEGQTDQDAVPEPPKKAVTKPGDLWLLGQHRLLCGDSTRPEDVQRVCGGQKPACMWTDPPYGVDYVGKTKNALRIKNDGREDLAGLLGKAFKAADGILAEGSAIYIAHPPGAQSVVFGTCFLLQGWRLHETLVWVKDSMVLGHSDYHYRHEPILFGYKQGAGRRGRGGQGWYGGNAETSVFEVTRPKASEDHPTMKPVELIESMVNNSSPEGGLVFDPFLGSGSTLLACERTRRRCIGLEIDPIYCDVIVKRWQAYTGKKAVLDKIKAKAA